MAVFKVEGMVTVSTWTTVEAASIEEAIEIASKRSMASHSIMGSYSDKAFWHFDNDGQPQGLNAEVATEVEF